MAQVKESQVIEILKQCFDPELPIDLWNLGLIYNIETQESYDELHSDVNIVMSLTTPGCTMGQQMSLDIKNKLEALDEVNQAFVEVTFEPPWNPEMMSAEAREARLLELQEELLQLRAEKSLGGTPASIGAYKATRRSIARLKTHMNNG